jgi:hypothetical protein
MNVEALEARIRTLEKQVSEQQKQIQATQDIQAIKRLQRVYGYYVQHMMRDEIIDCFADSPDVALHWLEGSWLGKESVKRYFGAMRDPGQQPPPEFLHQVMQLSGVVDVAPDGINAKGRWYAFGGISIPMGVEFQRSFASGIYEIEYIKENGIWKILTIRWIINYTVRLDKDSWVPPEQVGEAVLNPAFKPPQPDIPPTTTDPRFVSGYIFPFHYNHPVTGKETSEAIRNANIDWEKHK